MATGAGVIAWDEQLQNAFNDYTQRIKPYNIKQKKDIVNLTIQAFQGILAGFPAPRKENVNGNTPASPADNRQLKVQLSDLETVIADRLYTLNHDKSLFTRFDTKLTGFVTGQQLRVAIAILGVHLFDDEITALVNKYDSEGNHTLNYHDFLKYLQARREQPRSTNQDAFCNSLLNRTIPSNVAQLLKQLPKSLEERLAKGLGQLRSTIMQNHPIFIHCFNIYKMKISKWLWMKSYHN